MPSSRASNICFYGAALGAILFIVGVLWSLFGSARAVYSEVDAREYQAAAGALHASQGGDAQGEESGGSANQPPPAAPDRRQRDAVVAAARKRFERAQATLDRARFAQNRLGPWLAALGLATAAGFGVAYWASRG